MLIIVLRRLLQAVMVLLFVALISFLIFRYVGNPVESLLGQEATVAQRAALEEALGLKDPIYEQYANFVLRALQFDFGNSYRGALPVAQLIALRLPATLEGNDISNFCSNFWCNYRYLYRYQPWRFHR